MFRETLLGAFLILFASVFVEAVPERAERLLPHLDGEIVIDGVLDEPVWQHALKVDDFVEISPGDNVEPVVRTVVYLWYDNGSLYAAAHCFDPQPDLIRAAYSDRDSVASDQDFIQFDLDTRNDEKSSFIFRVNPRGIQADALFSEATGLDDFSPDYSFQAAAAIVKDGWIAEYRIPLSTLRYPNNPIQTWGITFFRNYPRQYRRQMTSNPIPRNSNCWLCHSMKLTGIANLPAPGYVLAVPYATAQGDSRSERGADRSYDMDGGFDVKWVPSNSLTLDTTWNPDFAQIEADVPQIAVNNRFALFYPEKRNFFLEGKDLLSSPINAVYTRTITSPAWGARGTGQDSSLAYTLLFTRDEGGGSRIVPGPRYSYLAPQFGESTVAVGRMRLTMGNSFAGLVLTDREGDGFYNRVIGPDLQWRPSDTNQVTAQFLVSSTQDPGSPENPAKSESDYAAALSYLHSTSANILQIDYQRSGHGFRADTGFVPQVGVERKAASISHVFYPSGWLRWIQPGFTWDSYVEPGAESVSRATYPFVQLKGRWNTLFLFEYHAKEQVRTESALLEHSFLAYNLKANVSRLVSVVSLSGNYGRQPDYANERIGRGGYVSATATLRPGGHLNTDLIAERQWLNVDGGRLFTADIAQVKATYNFNSRLSLRAILQYEKTRRNPALYSSPVPKNEGDVNGSLLFSYRLNWQTAIYAGYSQEQFLLETPRYGRGPDHFFLKIAYAFEH